MIIIVVVGLFYVSRYYKMSFDRQYDIVYDEREYTKVMTYNVLVGKVPELVPYIEKHNPDILCLQEIATSGEVWEALTQKYHTTKVEVEGEEQPSDNQILSKYEILAHGGIDGLSPSCAVWADLSIEEETVRVVSLHLQTTSIKPEDTRFIEEHEYLHDKERDDKMRSIVGRLEENNCTRAQQAECVATFLANTPHKTIVCGDFNDVPLSYTYNTIAKNLDDTFSQMADGFAYTYNTKYHLLRIDHILVSPSIEVASYEVDNKVELSDHYPVISRVKIRN
jgi:endonuclease/exonuclease/phosphatase family metal-dependent hydrolase